MDVKNRQLNLHIRPVHERAKAGSAFVDLRALRTGSLGFLDSLKATTARRIRRSMALYQARGRLDLTVAGDVDEALAFFDHCGKMHQERWTARAVRAPSPTPSTSRSTAG
ncbi:MAG: hypothetical protein HC871_17520 [Rhizobiales bacterium]|nr:hypothetical protein [Hyphomicrobiales bacterium]